MAEFINTVDVLGDEALTDSIIDRSITEIADNACTKIGKYALSYCTALTSINFPSLTTISERALYGCSALTEVNLPSATNIGKYAFYGCSALTVLDFKAASVIYEGALSGCSNLKALVLRNTKRCSTSGDATAGSAIAAGTCYVYVPASLVASYKEAPYFYKYPSAFRALEDYTVDGTVTGALDLTKI